MATSGLAGTPALEPSRAAIAVRIPRWPPAPVALLCFILLCPTFLSLDIAGLRLPPYRFLFLILLPLALVRMMSRPDIRIRGFDVLVGLLAVWQVAIYAYNDGQAGLVYGGSLALEILGGYFIARAYVRDPGVMISTVNLLVVTIAILGAIALIDMITGRYVLYEIMSPFLSLPPPTEAEYRWGLRRSNATFDHPIHYGVYCASVLALVWYAARDPVRRYMRAGFVAFATFLALSSAPLLSVGLQSAMIAWNTLTRGFPMRLYITLAIISGLYIGVMFVSNRPPLQLLITGMTFDPWTGIYRTWIWEHGLANVWASPWTGLGLADWERPDWMVASTIDSFWLVLAMRSGIPAFLILALAIGLLMRAVVRRGSRSKDPIRRRLAAGWMISLLALCLLGATVHYWNVLHTAFFFYLGLGGMLADPKPMRKPRPRAASHQHPAAVWPEPAWPTPAMASAPEVR